MFFANKGWFVGLYDIDEAGLRTLAGEIGEDHCLLQRLDVTNREQWGEAVQVFGEATRGQMHLFIQQRRDWHWGIF